MTSYLSPTGTLVFAHRGLAGKGTPENTLAAFEAALRAGATHIETDIQVSKDGVAVLFHDDDLKRVAGISKKVNELTLSEIRAIRVDGQSVPTLNEALESLPDARFNLDIKVAAAIEPTVRVIKTMRAGSRLLVSSFSHERRLMALQLLAANGVQVATSADGTVMLSLLWSVATNNYSSFARHCEGLDALQIPTRYFGVYLATDRLLAFAKRAGVQVHFWVINEPKQMLDLVARGATGIVTDRADVAVKLLR